MFSPEFAQRWLADQSFGADHSDAGASDNESLSQSQQEALEQLADRVNAARSVV